MFTAENGRLLLLETADILDGQEVPYFLIQGTALGAYRDHGFTPTEADIDIGVLHEDLLAKVESLVVEFIRRDFQIETFSLPFHGVRTIVAWKHGIHVDLVGFLKWNNKRFTCSPVHPSVVMPYAVVHDAGIIETYELVECFGRMWNAPSPIEAYLVSEYGESWRTPKHDPVSRARVYDFVNKECVPHDLINA